MVHQKDNGGTANPLRRGWSRSLKWKLIFTFSLVFIVVLSIVLLTGLWGIPFTRYGGRVAEHKAEAFRTLDLVADIKKERILNWFIERRADLSLAARRTGVRNAVAWMQAPNHEEPLPVSPGRDASAEERRLGAKKLLRTALLEIQTAYGTTYKSITVADVPSAGILTSTNEAEEGSSIAQTSAFTAYGGALSTGREYVSDVRLDRQNGAPALYFAHVILGMQNTISAVLIMEVDADDVFRPSLHSGSGLGANGETILVNQDGFVLVAPRFPMANGTVPRPLFDRITARPAQLAAGGQEGNIEVEDYRGTPVLAAYRYIRITTELGWGMVVKADRSEILAPLWMDIESSVFVGLAGILVVMAITTLIGARIVRPLSQLTRTASLLAGGDLSVRTGLTRQDEVGVLASAFDSMADDLQSAWTGLSRQTEALAQSRDSLSSRQRVQERALAVSNALNSAVGLDAVLEDGLNHLMKGTDSQAGAVYLRNELLPDAFKLRCSLGLEQEFHPAAVFTLGEGAAGLAALRREPVILEDIPDDTHYAFSTVAGKMLPQTILNLPLIVQDQVLGVIALAGIYPLSSEHMETIELCLNQLAIAITNALANNRTSRMAEELRIGNEELHAANEELEMQSEELRKQAETLRRQSEELERRRVQAEEADRLKSQFLANVSHELRTPLNSILALSQLLIHRGTDGDPSQEGDFLRVIERNGRRLLELINDLLDLAKIESGHMKTHITTIDPCALLQKIVETIKPLAEQKGLELELELCDIPLLHSDEDKLGQILLNLCSNAIKFTETGSITVQASSSQEAASFTVSDTGIGIAAADLPHIFEEFRQVNGSSTRKFDGTGLGLPIARKLARLLGGDISVQSVADRGSKFTLTVPVRTQLEPEVPSPSFPALHEPALAATHCVNPHILVVEDNEIAALQIRTILQESGYTVVVASGGVEALACLDQFVPKGPDGIILDLMMPEIDGFELLNQIRSSPGTAELPVLVLTAKSLSAEDRARLRSNKVQEFIQKGAVDREDLLDAVRRMVVKK
jgi:signal transduction histidine kinase/ActR/RegA family two-component response regulator